MEYSILYYRLKEALTSRKLEELSIKIIDAHRGKKEALLRLYADSLFPEDRGKQGSGIRLFTKLIKHVHPDKLPFIRKQLEAAFEQDDFKLLDFYNKILFAETEIKKQYGERFDFDYYEEYRYDEDEYGRDHYDDLYDEDYDEEFSVRGSGFDGDEEPEPEEDDGFTADIKGLREMDFLDALKLELLGNLNLGLDPGDLQSLEGELDLRDYGLRNLEGLQYCRNITVLDLSGNALNSLYELSSLTYLTELYLSCNAINDLEPLSGLANLEILDLSGNDVEDLSPLLSLENLSFADLRGNPVIKDKSFLSLKKRVTILTD